jgi:hypothetical protein
MGRLNTFICDRPNCREVKKETNNWYMYVTSEDRIAFLPLTSNERLLDVHEAHETVGLVCSKECAQKILEAYLDSIRHITVLGSDAAIILEKAAIDLESDFIK